MAASTSTTKRSTSPCGCGSSGAKPCSCGGSCGDACATCQGETYSRPRFFAGQLLTEDDLQQLGDYMVAKNRLHATHLFGAGVVCGLEVTCFPCGGGKVLVNPGYALDCCGNDIVLSCPQELDINQMVRDLQRKMRGGFDCGDPCAETQQIPAQPRSQGSAADTVEGRTPTGTEPKPVRHQHKYCLYVNYCEQPSDPVSPYATDDPCGSQTCETTRIREGFRFELRCPDCTTSEPAICKRYHDCLGEPVAALKTQNDADFLQLYGRKILAAQEAMRRFPSGPTFEPETFLAQLTQHNKALTDLSHNLPKNLHTTSSADAQAFTDASVAVASDVARYFLHSAPTLHRVSSSIPAETEKEIKDEIGRALHLLRSASTNIQSMEFETQLAKEYAASLADLVPRLSPIRSFVGGTGTGRPGEFEAPPEPQPGQPTPGPAPMEKSTLRWLAEGVLATRRMYNSAAASLEELRAFLVSRLEQQAMKTHCCGLDSVIATPKLQPVYPTDPTNSEIALLGSATSSLITTYRRLVQSCFCDALNPPCPSCDDPGVLLACITLENCKVEDICDLDRQFVLSPVAIRYWIPAITAVGRAIEKACCPDPCGEEWSHDIRERGEPGRRDPDLVYARVVARMLSLGCEEKSTALVSLASRFLDATAMGWPRGLRAMDLVREPALFASQTATPAAAAEDSPTVSELSARLERAQSDYEKLRAEFARLSEKVNRFERKLKNPE
jgi:hypothetical protein